jgi:hypothetical protein
MPVNASVNAVSGKLAIGVLDGVPNITAFARFLEGNLTGGLFLFGNRIDISVSGSLLSGGAALDTSKGINSKLAFGIGLGFLIEMIGGNGWTIR